MDFVAQHNETVIFKQWMETIPPFRTILEKNIDQLMSTPRKTFRYGEHEKHELDIYYPEVDAAATSKPPILYFIYGGRFVTGARNMMPPNDIAYRNLGHFFATQGFLTVIPDFRIPPHSEYPMSMEDIRDALAYSETNIPEGDPDQVFILAHGAGAAHVTSLYLAPSIVLPQYPTVLPRIKGLILVSGLYDIASCGHSPDLLLLYYVDGNKCLKNCPLGLLKDAPAEAVSSFPPTCMWIAEKDPDWLDKGIETFRKAFEEKSGRAIPKNLAKGHNHISLVWALSSNEGEEWAKEACQWIKDCKEKNTPTTSD